MANIFDEFIVLFLHWIVLLQNLLRTWALHIDFYLISQVWQTGYFLHCFFSLRYPLFPMQGVLEILVSFQMILAQLLELSPPMVYLSGQEYFWFLLGVGNSITLLIITNHFLHGRHLFSASFIADVIFFTRIGSYFYLLDVANIWLFVPGCFSPNHSLLIQFFIVLYLFLQLLEQVRVNNSLTSTTVGNIFQLMDFGHFFIMLLQKLVNLVLHFVAHFLLLSPLDLFLLFLSGLVFEHFPLQERNQLN